MWIFASVIIFVIVLTRQLRRQTRLTKEAEKSFWKREQEANNVRRKPLDDLEYIQIPLDRLPVSAMPEHETVHDCLEIMNTLSEQKIVNLTGYTNTDLKLKYGTANITQLTVYDQNYTMLVLTLQKWADVLYKAGYPAETRTILEFAVETNTDVSKTYYALAKIYSDCGESHRIKELIQTAETLNSIQQKVIVRNLKESYPYID